MEKNTQKFDSEFYRTMKTLLSACGLERDSDGRIRLVSNGTTLLESREDGLSTVLNDFSRRVYDQPSPLIDEDEFLSPELLSGLLESLGREGQILRLNHVGFCYPVDSMLKHNQEIKEGTSKQGVKLYSLPSNDYSEWLFVGDTSYWREPMLEFLPVPDDTRDREIDYWLPSVHINLDTNVFHRQIHKSINRVLKGMRGINPIVSDGNVVQVRVWLGVISGINLHLDIGTIAQNARYVRRVMLEEVK